MRRRLHGENSLTGRRRLRRRRRLHGEKKKKGGYTARTVRTR
jgi:hypothetical protein